jgi:hypothetical protein
MTAEMRAAVVAPVVRPIVFVYASFPDVEVRFWSGLGELQWAGETWLGTGSLLAIEDIAESTDSSQKGVAVRLSGVPSELFDATSLGNYQNRPAKIWFAALNEAFELIIEPYLYFSGVLDSDNVEDNATEVIITIFAESRLSDHLRARVFRYTHEDQQTLYPEADDRGLEFVAALQDAQLKWGTK